MRRVYFWFFGVVLPLVLAVFAGVASAGYVGQLVVFERDGIVERLEGDFFGKKLTSEDAALAALDELSEVYGFSDVFSELKLRRALENAGGFVLDFDQYYDGVYVYPRQIKISLARDFTIKTIYSNYLKNLAPHGSFALSEQDAIAALTIDGNVLSSRRVVFSLDSEPIFAYEIATDALGGTNFYVNAESGEVLRQIATAQSLTPYESVQTDYFGNSVPLTIAKENNGTYSLIDGYRNINVLYSTVAESLGGTQYNNSTGVFDDKEQNEHIAISALVNLQSAFDFYTDAQNIGISTYGVDNSVLIGTFGEATARREKQVNLIIYVGTKYNNAFCVSNNPNQYYTTLAFGDRRLYGIAKDVVSHEYQHSVNNYNASLVYANASGAIDEALADMFASLVEGHSMDENAFWDMGEDMGYPSRSAIEPERYWGQRGTVENQFPFCYESGAHDSHIYCDYGGVHYNATIITNSFYQMYLYAKEHNITTFTNQNLGILLYSALSKLLSDSSWVQFADAVLASAADLGLSESQTSELMDAIRYGFSVTGIYEMGSHQSRIEFRLGEFHTGTLPNAIVGEVGETFTIPESEVSREGGTFVGWTKSPNAITEESMYYVGSEYTFPKLSITLYPVSHMPRWNDFEFESWSGDGSSAAPYQISTSADLAALAYQMNYGIAPSGAAWQTIDGKHFELTANINLDSIDWLPIGIYASLAKKIYFDGGNYYIRNVSLATDTLSRVPSGARYQGLFGILRGEVKNVGIKGGYGNIKAEAAGGIAGLILDEGSVSGCNYEGTLYNTQENSAAGGIAGKVVHRVAKGTVISACSVTGQISAEFTGGIVGQVVGGLNSYATSSYDAVTVIGNSITRATLNGKFVGGIVGTASNVVLVNCINGGSVRGSGDSTYVGGLIGYLYYEVNFINLFSAILSCKNAGSLQKGSGFSSMGGVAGAIRIVNGTTQFQNIVIAAQDGVAIAGSGLTEQLSSSQVRFSTDAQYSGDFDFGNREYYLNSDNFSSANGVSHLEFLGFKFTGNRMPEAGSHASFWLVARAESFGGGKGTAQDPYIISTPEELALLSYLTKNASKDDDGVSFAAKHYRQTADIDLAGRLWTGIGSELASGEVNGFLGKYDGGGYAIFDMYATELVTANETSYAALFTSVGGTELAEVKRVRLLNAVAAGSKGAAGIAFLLSGKARLTDCIVSGTVTSDKGVAGAIAGKVFAVSTEGAAKSVASAIEISSCLNLAKVSAAVSAGILASAQRVGDGTLKLESNVNKGQIASYFMSGYFMINSSEDNITTGIIAITSGNADIVSNVNMGEVSNYGYGYASGIVGLVAPDSYNIAISGAKQTARIFALESGNASGILSIAMGKHGAITMDKCHYSGDIEPSALSDVAITNTHKSSDVAGEGDFDFYTLSYFALADYFEVSTQTYHLYKLISYEYGYVFASFIGGNGVIFEVKKIEVGSTPSFPIFSPIKPSSNEYDYQFKQWTLQGSPASPSELVVDTDYEAEFSQSARHYTIQFETNGGKQIETQQATYGEQLTLPTATKKGYKFDGWYKDQALTQKADTLTVTQDTTLYASWQKSKTCATVTPDDSITMLLPPILILAALAAQAAIKSKRKPFNPDKA